MGLQLIGERERASGQAMGCGGRGTQEQALVESPWWVVGELTEVRPA